MNLNDAVEVVGKTDGSIWGVVIAILTIGSTIIYATGRAVKSVVIYFFSTDLNPRTNKPVGVLVPHLERHLEGMTSLQDACDQMAKLNENFVQGKEEICTALSVLQKKLDELKQEVKPKGRKVDPETS